MTQETRYYIVLATVTQGLKEAYLAALEDDGFFEPLRTFIIGNILGRDTGFRIKALPSGLVGRLNGSEPDWRDPPDGLVVSLSFADDDLFKSFTSAIIENADKEKLEKTLLGAGADVPFVGTKHWCPSEAAYPIFGDRAAAERLLGVDYVRGQTGTDGDGVNVVVVDQGLDRGPLGANYGGGWPVCGVMPGTTKHRVGSTKRTHGMMIASNILGIAPKAKIFDLPLVPKQTSDIPSKISSIPIFLSYADAAFRQMLHDINASANPWILVNPWAIFDTSSDLPPPHDYCRNGRHIFNRLVRRTVRKGIDVVFSAGNCGQFCPDSRCGATDRGPGNSIFGANSLDAVLTAGAVRTDTMWIGYSSQGHGQLGLGRYKPDLCAPSQFREKDAFATNTGTSAACALATGIVAALRSKWYAVGPTRPPLSPADLKQLLIYTARKTEGPSWNVRLGHGILDAKAAYDELKRYIHLP
jgi:hypothetical protein